MFEDRCCINLRLSCFTVCVTQLMLYTGEKLSSPIFCCLWVSEYVRHRCHPTKSPLFPIYTGIQALWWPNTMYKGIKALFWVTHSILGLVENYLLKSESWNWNNLAGNLHAPWPRTVQPSIGGDGEGLIADANADALADEIMLMDRMMLKV